MTMLTANKILIITKMDKMVPLNAPHIFKVYSPVTHDKIVLNDNNISLQLQYDRQ